MALLWEVVGGADRGGILVRRDSVLSSVEEGRLATGATVKEVEWRDGRLCYELVSGTGPKTGWVTVSLRGKELLVKQQAQEHVSTSAGTSSEEGSLSPSKAQEKLTEDEKDAVEQYMEKFGENRSGGNPGYMRKAFPWAAGRPASTTPKEAIEALKARPNVRKSDLTEVDSEGEEVPLCTRCSLPVGEHAYEGKQGQGSCVHAECMAQVMVEDAQRTEDRRAFYEAEKKLKSRKEYEIGWRMESVPKNRHLAERLGGGQVPGLCCLVLDEASKTVKFAPTLEPAAAVNLEYLLLALKVRQTASREPLFSLDPVDPQNLEDSPQKKVYEPSWLAGTTVGDVMFQADYFLKELALGEYDMPVAGMMSVFDWSEMHPTDKAWAGREWFVVRKAEVRLAADKTLVPSVKMGVEAREQVITSKGLEDAPVTSATHPLKKFADAFTRNFDLIAERKSVVFHLRELAKASVMAKYLVDSKARLDPTWLTIADEIVKSTPAEAHSEIPQLWNMRGNTRVQLRNGRVIDMFTGGQRNIHAIYGGVQFGLDRFELAHRQAGMPLAQSGRPMFMPQRFQLGKGPEMPQGVDLNLDKFDLSRTDREREVLPACSGGPGSLETKVTLGKAFLESLQQGLPKLKEDHRELVQKIYRSPQCDRMEEGNSFIPPDPNMEYTQRLHSLVNDEKLLFDRRKMYFYDRGFKVGNAGAEFPRSWTSRFQIEKDGRAPASEVSNRSGLQKVDVDANFASTLLNDILPTAAPEFKEKTEDGAIFRIYQIGSLEVRTTQENFGKEQVGVVFSSRAPSWDLKSKKSEIREDEKLKVCKVFVEAAEGPGARVPCHFYMVFETAETKTVIVTEKLQDGTTTWAVNPSNLEDRNSLAKLLFTGNCQETTLKELKNLQASSSSTTAAGVSLGVRKQYAKAVFQRTTRLSFKGKWGGFVRRYGGANRSARNERAVTSRPTKWANHDRHDLLEGKNKLNKAKVSF